MTNENKCPECGHDYGHVVKYGDDLLCPQCGTTLTATNQQPDEEEAETHAPQFLCPDCQQDCSKISPKDGRVDCPRCGTFVRSISMNAFCGGESRQKSETVPPSYVSGSSSAKFNLVYATNAAAFMSMVGLSKMLGGDWDGGGAIIVIFAPVFFIIGGLIGWGRRSSFGRKSKNYCIFLGIFTILSAIGRNAIVSQMEENKERLTTGSHSSPTVEPQELSDSILPDNKNQTLRSESDQKLSPAQHFFYGLLYLFPEKSTAAQLGGFEKNYEKGEYHMRMAAGDGLGIAQAQLGRMYYQGTIFEQDYQEAVKWLSLAAEQNEISAMSFLGRCYLEGLGVLQDFQEARKYLTTAAEGGDSYGQRLLAFMYDNDGDQQKAEYWFRSSASQGDATSQIFMSIICEKRGDTIDAYAWALHAAKNGKPKAKEQLEKKLSQEDIVQGQQRAKILLNTQ